MERLYFENYETLSEYMLEMAESGEHIVAALFYADALKLLRELMIFEEVEPIGIEIEPEDYSGYDREYYVSVNEDLQIDIEKAYRNDRYLFTDPDILLAYGEVHSALLKDIPDRQCKEIYVGEPYVENCDYEYYHEGRDEDFDDADDDDDDNMGILANCSLTYDRDNKLKGIQIYLYGEEDLYS